MKAKVFTGHKCTTGLHNALLDVVMPELPPNAWKVLCVIIRQTSGWERDKIGVKYGPLMKAAGIGSKSTMHKAIEGLRNYRYKLIEIIPGSQNNESSYRVNRDVEIDWKPVDFESPSGTETVPLRSTETVPLKRVRSTETVPLRSTETVPSYRKEHDLLQNEYEKEKSLGDGGKIEAKKSAKVPFTEFKEIILLVHKITSCPAALQTRLTDDVEALIANRVTTDELKRFFASRRKRNPSIGYTCIDLLKWRGDTEFAQQPAATVAPAAPSCPRCNGNGIYGTAKGPRTCDCPAGQRKAGV